MVARMAVLFKTGVENDHDFVRPHRPFTTSLWTRRNPHGAPDGPEQGSIASVMVAHVSECAGRRLALGGSRRYENSMDQPCDSYGVGGPGGPSQYEELGGNDAPGTMPRLVSLPAATSMAYCSGWSGP